MGRGCERPDEGEGVSPGASSGVDDVLAGLALVGRGLGLLVGARVWSLSDAQVRDAVLSVTGAVASLEAARLGLVRELDGRAGAVAGARAGQVAATFLVEAARVASGQAHRDVAAARMVDPDGGLLAGLGAALAAGAVSRAHVEVAVGAVGRIPARLLAAVGVDGVSGAARVDGFLSEQSRRFSPVSTARLVRHLLAVLDPDGTDRFDPDAWRRRGLSCATDSTGMLVGRFQLDPAGGAAVAAALEAFARPDPAAPADTEDGQRVMVADDRTRPQRYADALVAIPRAALQPQRGGAPDAGGAEVARSEATGSARVLILATADQLPFADGTAAAGSPGTAECLQTGPLTPRTSARLSCDAVLHRALVAPSGAVCRWDGPPEPSAAPNASP